MDFISQLNKCKCGMPERWVADPKYPVEFDKLTNEYHLACEDGIAVMRYCFWCGGRLPESKRGDLFSTPGKEEEQEIQRLLSTAKTVDAVLQVLGKPDETFEWDEATYGISPDVLRWKQTLHYSSRWKTLILVVMEMPDGEVRHWVSGQYIGKPPEEMCERRWWQLWKFKR